MFPSSYVLLSFFVISILFSIEMTVGSVKSTKNSHLIHDDVDFCTREPHQCVEMASSENHNSEDYPLHRLEILQMSMRDSPPKTQNDLVPCYFCQNFVHSTINLAFHMSREILLMGCKGIVLEVPQRVCLAFVEKMTEGMNSMLNNVHICGDIGMCLPEGTENSPPNTELFPCKFCKTLVNGNRKVTFHIMKELMSVVCTPFPKIFGARATCLSIIKLMTDKLDSTVGDIPLCSYIDFCMPEVPARTLKSASGFKYTAFNSETNLTQDDDQSENSLSNEFLVNEELFSKRCKRWTSTLAKVFANDQYKKQISKTIREICLNSQVFQEQCQLLGDNSFNLIFNFLSTSLNSTKMCDEVNFGFVEDWKDYLVWVDLLFKSIELP